MLLVKSWNKRTCDDIRNDDNNLYEPDCWEGSGLVGKRWWVQSTNCIACFRRVALMSIII